VAEVEDQRTRAQRLKDGVDALFQRLAAGNEPERVEIALYGSPGLEALRLAQRYGPVEAKTGDAGALPVDCRAGHLRPSGSR
jgi:hypothetical protein